MKNVRFVCWLVVLVFATAIISLVAAQSSPVVHAVGRIWVPTPGGYPRPSPHKPRGQRLQRKVWFIISETHRVRSTFFSFLPSCIRQASPQILWPLRT
jgi:hypothetical protein